MGARILAERVSLDVPTFLQSDQAVDGWGGLFMGAAFQAPRRKLVRLLDSIDLEVNEGDRLALLGRNGAGKSTLLRVLNRVYQPTEGRLDVQGSCQALLNMSLGFNGEATVTENVYLRAIAMGLRSSFIRHHMKSILEFSGLEEKAGHRLRTLSSGQKMRLGFAISTSVQHDIMLMDEWVGAGDSEFMAKATQRMKSRVGGSKIVVLASHSVGLLRDLCNKGIVVERGRLVHAGDIASSLRFYHGLMADTRKAKEFVDDGAPTLEGAQVYGAIEDIKVDKDGECLVLTGWMIDTAGAAALGLVVEIEGHRHVADSLTRVARPDVMRHFGLSSDLCGFMATVSAPGLRRLTALQGKCRILGGASPDTANAPLRLAANAAAALSS